MKLTARRTSQENGGGQRVFFFWFLFSGRCRGKNTSAHIVHVWMQPTTSLLCCSWGRINEPQPILPSSKAQRNSWPYRLVLGGKPAGESKRNREGDREEESGLVSKTQSTVAQRKEENNNIPCCYCIFFCRPCPAASADWNMFRWGNNKKKEKYNKKSINAAALVGFLRSSWHICICIGTLNGCWHSS